MQSVVSAARRTFQERHGHCVFSRLVFSHLGVFVSPPRQSNHFSHKSIDVMHLGELKKARAVSFSPRSAKILSDASGNWTTRKDHASREKKLPEKIKSVKLQVKDI